MMKAEQRALEQYPIEDGKMWTSAFGTFEFDRNYGERQAFQKGYEQAEKDFGWINAREELPNKGEVVLTCWNVNGYPQGIGLRLYDDQWQNFDDDDVEVADPDYWMYIPQIKEENK